MDRRFSAMAEVMYAYMMEKRDPLFTLSHPRGKWELEVWWGGLAIPIRQMFVGFDGVV